VHADCSIDDELASRFAVTELRTGRAGMFAQEMENSPAMREFSATGEQAINAIAQRHNFSPDAVASMLRAVVAGHGRMAQFRHPEFGGSGQWMRGGMTMVGDMFDTTLKARVERLCDELARLVASEPDVVDNERAAAGLPQTASLFAEVPARAQGSWWPAELGRPNSAGTQNGMRYAYFAAPRRLAIDAGGRVDVYDTLDHHIGGAAQQQSARGTVTFTSQHGVVDVNTLPRVAEGPARRAPDAADAAEPQPDRDAAPGTEAPPAHDVVATIEKLAELREKGILTEAEFSAKKTELLGRL
jgi:Short C-terminal domain